MSIAHSKNLNPSLNLIINSISTKYAPQILAIKSECTFILLNVLIIGLCNSGNSLLEMFLFLIPLPDVLFIKNIIVH